MRDVFCFDACLQNAAKRDRLRRHVRPSVLQPVRIKLAFVYCAEILEIILAIFTKMYRSILNYPISCIEQLDTISKPKNTRKCVKNTVCIVYFHTRTCVFFGYIQYLSTKFKFFFLNRTKITDIYTYLLYSPTNALFTL
jgi:hypothetical protein